MEVKIKLEFDSVEALHEFVYGFKQTRPKPYYARKEVTTMSDETPQDEPQEVPAPGATGDPQPEAPQTEEGTGGTGDEAEDK